MLQKDEELLLLIFVSSTVKFGFLRDVGCDISTEDWEALKVWIGDGELLDSPVIWFV